HGYGDNRDTGYSTLDAARSLRKLLDPSSPLGPEVVVLGHSEGGGAALSAQALAKTYGAGGELVAAIAHAPGWQVDAKVDGFRYADTPTTYGSGFPAVIGSLLLYAYSARHLGGAAHGGDAFGATARAAAVRAIEHECVFALAESLPRA